MTATLDIAQVYQEAAQTRLTEQEIAKLERCEAVIERGKQAFLATGNALADIQEQRLYREGYATWNDYLRERWNIGRSHAGRLIAASVLAEEMSPIGVVVENENQARVLGQMEPEVRQAAVTAAKEQHGEQVSGRDVIAAAEAAKPAAALPPAWWPSDLAGFSDERLRAMEKNIAASRAVFQGKRNQPNTNVEWFQGEISKFDAAQTCLNSEWQRRLGADAPSPALNTFMQEAPASPGENDVETQTTAHSPRHAGEEGRAGDGAANAAGGNDIAAPAVASERAADAPVARVSAPPRVSALNTGRLNYPVEADGMAALRQAQCDGMLPNNRIKAPILLDGHLWVTRTVERGLDDRRDVAHCLRVVEYQHLPEHTEAVTGDLRRLQIEQGTRAPDDYSGLMVTCEDGKVYVLLGVIRNYEHTSRSPAPAPVGGRLEETQATGTPPVARQAALEAVPVAASVVEASAEIDTDTDAAWHDALETVVLERGGYLPDLEDDAPLRVYWARALGGWLDILAEINGLNSRLNAVRTAAAKFAASTAPHNHKALQTALERYVHYVAHEMQTPPVSAVDSVTLDAGQTRLLAALAEKRNSILRGQREHSGGRLEGKEEVTPGELLTELLEQKAAQAGVELESLV